MRLRNLPTSSITPTLHSLNDISHLLDRKSDQLGRKRDIQHTHKTVFEGLSKTTHLPRLTDFRVLKTISRGSFGYVYLVRKIVRVLILLHSFSHGLTHNALSSLCFFYPSFLCFCLCLSGSHHFCLIVSLVNGRLLRNESLAQERHGPQKPSGVHPERTAQFGSHEQSLHHQTLLQVCQFHCEYFIVCKAHIHCSFQTVDNLYMVMEYCNGGDLFSLLRSAGMLSESWTKFYVAEIALSLEHIHSFGTVHRGTIVGSFL